jgi:hypothetical protein
VSPLQPLKWWKLLREYNYPDIEQAHKLVSDMITGFHIGYHGDRNTFRDSPNLPIPVDMEHHIDEDMEKELKANRRAGPFTRNTLPYNNLVVSPIGVVDKKNSNKKRVIHHLSWPRNNSNSSINTSVEETDTKLQSFDDALQMIINASRMPNTVGINLSKVDVQSAYRIIPTTGTYSASNGEAHITSRKYSHSVSNQVAITGNAWQRWLIG